MADKRAPLSRELITNTALDVVAREGLAALSMRRLAQELDVWPMSMYRHFRDKEDLLDAVAAAGAEGVELPPGRGSARKQLSALAAEARASLARQPGDLRRRTLTSPGMLRLRDAALDVLRGSGSSPAEAEIAWRAVLAYVIGSIELDAATETGDTAAFDDGLERVLRGTITA
jgi:TetR/AcrR family tetracycline transcriptional repressor